MVIGLGGCRRSALIDVVVQLSAFIYSNSALSRSIVQLPRSRKCGPITNSEECKMVRPCATERRVDTGSVR
jgi:hypothetical protein